MISKTIFEKLDIKISSILIRYEDLKEENRLLKETINSNKETEARLRQEIFKLKEEDKLKNLEIEDIVLRIIKSMGLVLGSQNISKAS